MRNLWLITYTYSMDCGSSSQKETKTTHIATYADSISDLEKELEKLHGFGWQKSNFSVTEAEYIGPVEVPTP